MLKEFKAFIMRGNVVDLAVAIILGAAFSTIVTSLVNDIITPLILNPALRAVGVGGVELWTPGGIALGKFIAAIINFVVVAFCIFIIVKGMNKAMTLRKKKEDEAPAPPAEPSNEEKLLMEIRDLLKNK
ncbi:large conductance mechanosensitive channel protein MscL [Fluviicola taffensis]|uniref:large conductance mechanosensitive channel protein MscL n=1 Tax=Fluviicola taffensis TaxID=191579 RepID=UPI00313800E8